ncbi:hypothetical protein PRK78_006281 [Emydomyces testavorans]|uniref:SET domain-containing protein n=1 Tax=Emydomyces testavorans TaxID=2070801 RepID=A0AAF0IKQ1_9EURO|nr:hypothetical protein PRK78_006281 [Emydomyces testavorans]
MPNLRRDVALVAEAAESMSIHSERDYDGGSEGSLTPTQSLVVANPPSKSTPKSLLDWINELGGGLSNGIEISTDPIKGQCLRVREALPENLAGGTCTAICPVQATMSVMNLENLIQGVPPHGFIYSPDFLSAVKEGAALAFFLMDQYLLGDESFWAPYIRSLPDESQLTRLEYYSGDDLEWLEGTNLLKLRNSLLDQLKTRYEVGLRLLKEFPNKNTKDYTWELFLWASSIIISRAFTSEILKDYFSDLRTLLEASGDFSVLVPLLDMTNHQPLAKVEWRTTQHRIGLMVHKTLMPGEEVPNNYGPRNNERLLLNYGFCIPGNVCDYREISLKPPANSPFFMAKKEQQKYFHVSKDSTDEERYYIYNIFYPLPEQIRTLETSVFSLPLFDAMTVMSANDRELVDLQIEKNRIYVPIEKYGNSHCVLEGLGQMIMRLMSNILALKASPCFGKEPENTKQRNAKLYREAQLYQSEGAIAIAEWTLLRARVQESLSPQLPTHLNMLLEALPKERFDKNAQERIRWLIANRLSVLKHGGELFQGDDVSQALTKNAEEPFRTCIRSIIKAMSDPQNETPHSTGVKLTYTIFLCFCAAAYRNIDKTEKVSEDDKHSILTGRLQKWIPFLLEHYAEPPAAVRWLLEDDDIENLLDRIEGVFTATRRTKDGLFSPLEPLIRRWKADDQMNWLSGNRMRWAWLTVKEESVDLARDPLSFLSDAESASKPMPFDTYLYIPYAT